MRILVLWADEDSPNLGVQALAAGTARVVREAWPSAQVDIENHTAGPWPRWAPPLSTARAFVGGDRKERYRLSKYDLVVDTASGDSFTDIYGMKRLFQMASTRASAVHAGCTVVLGPQTLGPFNSRAGRLVARASLRGVAAVFARDSRSAEVCGTVLRRQALRATDVVFALPTPAKSTSRDVVVNVSGLLWWPNPHVDHLHYRTAVEQYCRDLRSTGRRVSLLAHVVSETAGETDNQAVRELATALGDDIECLFPESLDDVRGMLATGRLTVGARMHACLNSLSVGVPALGWAYSRKFDLISQDLGWPHVFDLREGPSVARASMQATEALQVPSIPELVRLRSTADARIAEVVTALRQCYV